ncbi:MAG: DUF3443 family protein [Terriglobia bacterium]
MKLRKNLVLGRLFVVLAGLMVLAGCGGGSNTTTTTTTTTTPVANTVSVAVNSGPANNAVNFAYVSVQVCNPGSATNCVTIPDVQVDTGSSGLRILASAPGVSGLSLKPVTGSNAAPVYECIPFAADYLWGQVEQADVSMAGEKAASLPLQVISSSATPSNLPSSCSAGSGSNLASSTALQANGILGIGNTLQDCGIACTGASVLPYYWLCPCSGCILAQVPTATQVSNPVGFFNNDDNGVILAMGPLAAVGAASATGTLTFGIGTQSDNAFSSSAKAYAISLNSQIYFSIYLTYNNVTYPALIDSSEFYNFFLDSTTVAAASAGTGITSCLQNNTFYCTSSAVSLPFTATDGSGDSAPASIKIGDGTTLWNSSAENGGSNAAFSNLAGGMPLGASDYVVLGMPFFYGRAVYVGIAGKVPPTGVPSADADAGYWGF